MGTKLGDLTVSLEANMAKFSRDMEQAASQTEKTMGKIQGAANMVTSALGLIGVGISFAAIVGQADNAIDALANLDDMAQKTGASVDLLSRLGKVADMTGADFGKVDVELIKLAKNMETADEKGSKFARAMNAIGLSTKGIKDQDPAQVFIDISKKLQDYADGGGKAVLMQDLISKSAAEMLPYMNDVAESVDKFKGVTAEAAAAASRYQDGLGLVRIKYTELTTSIVTAALPAAADFVGALGDLIEGADGVKGVDVAAWADDVAIGLARVVDVAMLLPRLFSAIAGSAKVVYADIETFSTISENVNPVFAAKKLLDGENLTDNINKALADRKAVITKANAQYDELFNAPVDRMEAALMKRIAARNTGGASGDWGREKEKLKYAGGDDAPDKAAAKAAKEAQESAALLARLKEQEGALGLTGAALLSYKLESMNVSEAYKVQARALQTTIDTYNAEEEALKKGAEAKKKLDADMARAAVQNKANVDQISVGLMSEVAREENAHQLRLNDLQIFHDTKLENVMQANALMEAENLRHEQTKAAMQLQFGQQVVGMAGDSASQLYGILQSAGMEQTALGRALFIANKAIAVAEIIMNTEVAAAKALALGPIVGPPMAMAVRVMGYAAAGVVIGTTIASAEGGYDIPAGSNPVTQLHEKEMVLPRAQADVIRGLATNGTGAGKGVSINYSPTINIDGTTDMARNRQMVRDAVEQGNADLVDRLQRAGRI